MLKGIDWAFIIFYTISLIIAVAATVVSVIYNRKSPRSKRVVSAWQCFTAGIYISIFFQYLPVVWIDCGFSGFDGVVDTFFTTLFQSLRVFIVESDYNIIKGALSGCHNWVKLFCTIYSTFFFILAPILTAGVILSFFRNFMGEIKLFLNRTKPVYLLSKLNPMSIALARSIREEANKNGEKPLIIFADALGRKDEDDYLLYAEATEKDVNAICLKKDVTHIGISLKSRYRVEIFLIDDDVNESENVGYAIRLTELYKNRENTKVFLYATSVGSGYIVDSLDKGEKLLTQTAKDIINGTPKIQEQLLFSDFDNIPQLKDLSFLDGGFKLSRIDNISDQVLDTFVSTEIFKLCKATDTKTISILIVGMGKYGIQIFKTALWYCQAEGYNLQINVIDSGIDRNGERRDIEKLLAQQCPEIIANNPSFADGDCNYDIRFFKNIDCFSSDFDRIFTTPKSACVLKNTLLSFVALGDDDKNIEVAIMLRKLFDRMKGVNKSHYTDLSKGDLNDLPIIYSVVYDDQKSENLNVNLDASGKNQLINYKGIPYHIRFMGNLSSRYSYQSLVNKAKLEKTAFIYHTNWVNIEKRIRDEIYDPKNAHILKKLREEKGLSASEPIGWDDAYLYADADCKVLSAEMKDAVMSQIENYMKFEYYKNSSISKAVHKTALSTEAADEFACATPENGFLCDCPPCERRRKTEHMRWNAYMRVNGYIRGDIRGDRGRIHTDLVTFDQLDIKSKYKD